MKFLIKFFCFLYALIISITCRAQETELTEIRRTLSIAGASAPLHHNGRTYTIHQSIGQSGLSGTLESDNLTLRQGFIQPETKVLVRKPKSTLEVLAFPNPFQNFINIHLKPNPTGPWRLDLFDISGRAVYQEKFIVQPSAYMNFQHLVPGVYVLRVTSDTRSKSIRIVKL